MYNHILVPVSFDAERDTSAPIKLAQVLAAPDARVTLLHVVEHVPSYAIAYVPSDYMAEARVAIQNELEDLAAQLPNARAVVIEGHSSRSILDWIDSNKPDLVIIASHRPGVSNLWLGSTATQVVRHAPCAVHVVR